MKKALLLFLTSVLVVSFVFAQGQQLKTLHHLQGKDDMSGLTYTGYEDELGNIVRQGAFTYKIDGFSMSLYYNNNILDGDASITYNNPKLPTYKLSCKMKYKDGQLKEIDFEEIGDYDGYKNRVFEGRRVFKCFQNERGLPSGEFECSIAFTLNGGHNESIKGRFDDSGKATGYWDISASVGMAEHMFNPNRASFGEMGSKVYYEKGYCLGTNDNSIAFGRKYLVEKSVSEQELLNKGFSFDKNAIQVKYPLMSQTSHQPDMTIGNTLDMVTVNVKRMCDIVHDVLYYGRRGQNYTLFGGLYDLCPQINFSCNYAGAFENGFMKGSLITYMSSELYQSILNQIKNNNRQATLKYDAQLDKFYVLKVDGVSRLYIPIESENEFKGLFDGPCPSTMTDYDGNTYNTVKIGTQCWMKENLKTTHYSDGTEIALGNGRYNPNGNSSEVSMYGFLYDWYAIMHEEKSSDQIPSRVQGICPTGWHVPSVSEWGILIGNIRKPEYACDNDNSAVAKSLSATWGWKSSEELCAVGNLLSNNDATGFSAVPAGFIYNAAYDGMGKKCYMWSSTEYEHNSEVSIRGILHDSPYDRDLYGPKRMGISVRCLKDY